jgi:hypothetical protein
MIPCPKLPIFTYGTLCTPQKLLVLTNKIEGSMKGVLKYYKIGPEENLIKTNNPLDQVHGEILWINLKEYEELIKALDSYGKPSHKEQKHYERFLCEVLTNEPVYRGIPPTLIECWSYQIK